MHKKKNWKREEGGGRGWTLNGPLIPHPSMFWAMKGSIHLGHGKRGPRRIDPLIALYP